MRTVLFLLLTMLIALWCILDGVSAVSSKYLEKKRAEKRPRSDEYETTTRHTTTPTSTSTFTSTTTTPRTTTTTTTTQSTTTASTTTTTTEDPKLAHLPNFDDYRSIDGRHVSCNVTQYQCGNGRECIDRSALCNGVEDCSDGTDEGGKCDECQYENGGCDHQCSNTPNGPECLCNVGWRRSHDGISCEDEDECAHGRGFCQHFCHNTVGGYTCSCATGYILEGDGSTCKLEKFQAGHLLFSVGHQVRNLPLNSWSDHHTPEVGVMCDVRQGTVEGLDATTMNGHYYYTRNGGIYANLESEICLVQGLHDFGANVAVDWVTGNLYFANEDPASLGLCRSDGKFCTALMTRDDDLGSPRGLALLPKFGIMFWTDWGKNAKIERANMDGTGRRAIVSDRLVWPNAIAIDYVHNLVYFADSEFNMIERCRLDGSHREVVIKSGVFHPFDMVVFDDHVFWTDWGLYGVMTTGISNDSDHHRLYYTEYEQPYGIALLHPAYHESGLPNPCSNMSCSHMCALTTHEHAPGHVLGSCLCPTNYTIHNTSQGVECRPHPNHEYPHTGPQWCLDSFLSACDSGSACENGGVCKIDRNQHGVVAGVHCECESDFVGEFCEVRLLASETASAASRKSGLDGWSAALLILFSFVLITCVCVGLLCRYGRYRQKIHSLRWSPSVIFRKTALLASKNGKNCDQRQRIISSTDDGSKNSLCKTDSFANPVYEEVQVPVHHAYMVFKREDSAASHDSDADSGLEFSTANGSP